MATCSQTRVSTEVICDVAFICVQGSDCLKSFGAMQDCMKKHPEANTEPLDIEDLVKIGQVQGPCPYFLSREMAGGAELVFMPYQYLIDAKTRIGLDNISWEDAILIFDEAHNLEVGLGTSARRQEYGLLGASYICEAGTFTAAQGNDRCQVIAVKVRPTMQSSSERHVST